MCCFVFLSVFVYLEISVSAHIAHKRVHQNVRTECDAVMYAVWGALKTREWKMQEWKMQEYGWKMQEWKMQE